MDENKVSKDGNPISKVEKSRKPKGRKPGTPKTGGRSAGTPNKKNVYMKDILADSGFDFGKSLASTLAQLTPQERISVLIQMFKFIAPELNSKDAPNDQDLQTNNQPLDVLKVVGSK